MSRYTLVQHSAYHTGHTEFILAVEGVGVTELEAKRVTKAGGVLFESYIAVEDAAERANYPADYTGPWLIPNAKGTFSSKKISGLPIYIPEVNA